MKLDSVITASENLSRLKRKSIGIRCPNFPKDSVDKEDISFKDTVTHIWMWYHEEMKRDIDFLTTRAKGGQKRILTSFRKTLNNQRNFYQHANFDQADAALKWRKQNGMDGDTFSDSKAIDALLSALEVALSTAIDIAFDVSNNDEDRKEWTTRYSVTSESEIMTFLTSIGRFRPSDSKMRYFVHNFDNNPLISNRSSVRAEDRKRIAAKVVLGVDLPPLSMPYDEVLDRFQLLGDQRGFSLLLLAHAIQSSGKEIFPLITELWPRIDLD